MKIAILGGSGFIGRNLAKELHSGENEVVIFSRQKSLPSELRSLENIRLITSSKPEAKDLEGFEAIVNLVGEPIIGRKWDEEIKEILTTSRVDFTKSLILELAKVNKKPKVFLQGSAIGFYGMQESSQPVFSENGLAGKDFLAKLCVDWETESLRANSIGIRTILLRTGIVLSKESGALEKMLPAFKMFVGGPIGNGNQYMSWIHIKDMILAIQFLINDSKAKGAFNITAPNPCSNEYFSSSLGKILNRPTLFRVPEFALKTLYGEGAEVLLKGQNVVPAKLTESGFQFKFPEIESALSDLIK